nr:MAG TPA: hypothetical protein [Caudoviricetes sp.]
MKGTTAYILAKKLFDGLSSGYQSNTVTDNADGSKTLTINFVNGDTAQITFSPVKGDKGDTGTGVADLKITTTSGVRHLTAVFDDGTEKDCGILPNEQYDDTQIKSDISSLQTGKVDKVTGKSLIDDTEIARLKDVDNYDDTAIKTLINTVANGLMASAGYSADYKTIDIVTVGGTKKSIDVLPVISHAKITELSDVDSTNQGNGKTLVYNSATGKHEYADSSSTDELVKMDASTSAKYLGDLIDKTTIVNDNGTLKAKSLDGLDASITELNYIKGLQMPVQDLVTAFANGGLKTIDTPFATYADLQAYDVSTLLDDIRYLVRVLADETHDGKITAYLIKKDQTVPTFYGFLSDSRDFTTNPIDLVNEITGKLKAKNIDSDDLFALLTLSDVYKTTTTKDEIFGTNGAKAMYDELTADIGNKADSTTLTTHINDTDIHTSTTEKATWNTVTSKANQSDLASHVGDNDIHITSAERTAWNGKIDKSSITTTIDSTSTDNQVPSAKIINEMLGSKYGKQPSSKLNEYTTVLDWAKNNIGNSVGYEGQNTYDDCPLGDTWGTIICLGNSVNTGLLVIAYHNFKNTIYYRVIKGGYVSTATWITEWTRICTTSVADVGLTNIAPSDTTTFINFKGNSSCNYYVKNGVCYVSLWGVKIASTGSTIKPGVILPKCANNRAGVLMTGTGDATAHAFAFIIDTGELCFDVKDANISLYGSFSYPVAES